MPRYFYDKYRDLILEVEVNPCGCCPTSFTIVYGKRFSQKGWYSFVSKSQIEDFLSKWVELK